nr:uncharacterized protein LOC111855653 isoform X1 [Paramormyrops kingsleyae]
MFLRDVICFWTTRIAYFSVMVMHISPMLSMPTQPELITGQCNSNITIQCGKTHKTSEYRVIIWYKINDTNQSGIIRKSHGVVPKRYGYSRDVSMDSSGGLFLPWLQPEDSGRYLCHLGAFVGGRNEDFSLELNVSECVTPVSPTFTDVSANQACCTTPPPYKELSAAWLASSFSLVSFFKALLCFLVIWLPIMVKRKLRSQS